MEEKKVHFPGLAKKKLRDFNKAEVQGWVIERFCRIEERIDNIIIAHFNPQEEKLFRDIVLSSSIMTIGAKIKILVNLGLPNFIIDKIRKLSAIRNGFAHTIITSRINVTIPRDSEPKKAVEVEAESIINVMNASGKIISKNAHEYLSEYLQLLKEVEQEI